MIGRFAKGCAQKKSARSAGAQGRPPSTATSRESYTLCPMRHTRRLRLKCKQTINRRVNSEALSRMPSQDAAPRTALAAARLEARELRIRSALGQSADNKSDLFGK